MKKVYIIVIYHRLGAVAYIGRGGATWNRDEAIERETLEEAGMVVERQTGKNNEIMLTIREEWRLE